jgi:hypothetical protein
VSDAQKKISKRMSTRMRASLKGLKSGASWESLVGYTAAELKKHIERQFTEGMSWENMSEWHIDHIVPIAAFVFDSYESDDFKACWSITNLRPLWASENVRKHASRNYLL